MAYLLLVHKNFDQICDLIERLQDDDTKVFLSVDKKSEELRNRLIDFALNKNNVVVVNKSYTINWGGFNMIRATLAGMERILNDEDEFRYVHLLSGQDYPIKKREDIKNFFKDSEREYLHTFELPNDTWIYDNGGFDRVDYFYDFDNPNLEIYEYKHIMNAYGEKKKRLEGYKLYGGQQWWSLTYDCIRYIMEFVRENYEFVNYYKYSAIPDEMFFNTLIMNSPFKDKVYNNSYRYMRWTEGEAHPDVLRENDINVLGESGALWARKFDVDIDGKILEEIKNRLH